MPSYKPTNYPPPGRVRSRRASDRNLPTRQSATSPNVPVSVQVSSTIGIAPLLIDYAVTLQRGVERGADVLWADNGIPTGNGLSGQKVLTIGAPKRLLGQPAESGMCPEIAGEVSVTSRAEVVLYYNPG